MGGRQTLLGYGKYYEKYVRIFEGSQLLLDVEEMIGGTLAELKVMDMRRNPDLWSRIHTMIHDCMSNMRQSFDEAKKHVFISPEFYKNVYEGVVQGNSARKVILELRKKIITDVVNDFENQESAEFVKEWWINEAPLRSREDCEILLIRELFSNVEDFVEVERWSFEKEYCCINSMHKEIRAFVLNQCWGKRGVPADVNVGSKDDEFGMRVYCVYPEDIWGTDDIEKILNPDWKGRRMAAFTAAISSGKVRKRDKIKLTADIEAEVINVGGYGGYLRGAEAGDLRTLILSGDFNGGLPAVPFDVGKV
ncbi:MAG: hypothetical protein K2K68_01405 [Duncaniella sp.]|nr:hypothetical protein [Duncaniella sp.]